MPLGELKKMKIVSYTKADYSDDSKDGEFEALINPESYQLEYKIEYNSEQGQGASSSQQKFKFTKPEDLSFEFLFDATGALATPGSALGQKKEDIVEDIQRFKDMLTAYDSSSHQPRHLKLFWGTMLFKGRMASLQIQFKLFKPDGRPLRAVAKASFKGSVEENLRVALENSQSPDVTHLRTVLAGDSLPLMCYRIYGDSKHYLEVARANGLASFRSLRPGDELVFPPIEKATTA
jgi:nucleoid-associated protein YgaU